MSSHLIAPTRAEGLIDEGSTSLRYITFFEQIADKVTKSDSWSNTVVEGNTYTTTSTERLVVDGVGTITLNSTPDDGETVNVISQNGEVTVESTKLINGETEIVLWLDNTSLIFVYIKAKDTWFIV